MNYEETRRELTDTAEPSYNPWVGWSARFMEKIRSRMGGVGVFGSYTVLREQDRALEPALLWNLQDLQSKVLEACGYSSVLVLAPTQRQAKEVVATSHVGPQGAVPVTGSFTQAILHPSLTGNDRLRLVIVWEAQRMSKKDRLSLNMSVDLLKKATVVFVETGPSKEEPEPAADPIKALTDERGSTYGHPSDNFRAISAACKALGVNILHEDPRIAELEVARFMVITKISRLMTTPDHRDSWMDIAGYARTGTMCLDLQAELEGTDQ